MEAVLTLFMATVVLLYLSLADRRRRSSRFGSCRMVNVSAAPRQEADSPETTAQRGASRCGAVRCGWCRRWETGDGDGWDAHGRIGGGQGYLG